MKKGLRFIVLTKRTENYIKAKNNDEADEIERRLEILRRQHKIVRYDRIWRMDKKYRAGGAPSFRTVTPDQVLKVHDVED